MAINSDYKQKGRKSRQSTIETDFSSGMQYTNGVVQEGYVKTLVNFDYTNSTKTLVPRAGLRTSEFIFPDLSQESVLETDLTSEDISIKYAKECFENGVTYKQFIIGELGEDPTEGTIHVLTSGGLIERFDVDDEDGGTFEEKVSVWGFPESGDSSSECAYYSTELPEIHGTPLTLDTRTANPIGTFGFNNSFYFIGKGDNPGIKRTIFDSEDKKYKIEPVNAVSVKAGESVTNGYNMLLENPYAFENTVISTGNNSFVIEGILPYDQTGELMMTPRKNQLITFKAPYTAQAGTYTQVWEWRTASADEWIEIKRESLTVTDGTTECSVEFAVPSEELLVRVQVYPDGSDVIAHAMTVGFDFSKDENSSFENIQPTDYDLLTASGMVYWKNRLVLWGLPQDPTILFISDLNEPGYFPYPNNITVFDEPVIAALEFMDTLVVFTTSKIYQVSVNEDGDSWTSTLLQSHLHIEPWDKHLIQTVRNMIYFKSGNYYYMLVPKAQSTTGELTLAPISTPITEFFNNFSANVEHIFREVYMRGSDEPQLEHNYELVTYYNFLDYENIHNIYAYRWSEHRYVHFDIIYNTVDRYWRICIYEQPHLLFPYRNDATQYGLLASTSCITFNINDGTQTIVEPKRTIQILKFDPRYVQDFYIPVVQNIDGHDVTIVLYYSHDFNGEYYENHVAISPLGSASFRDTSHTVFFEDYLTHGVEGHTCVFTQSEDYYEGFMLHELAEVFSDIQKHSDTLFTYRNWQFLDTGYRDDVTYFNKRYRELQLQLNNLDNQDLQYGMDFLISGEPRKTVFKYEVSQVIDEMDHNYNIAYIDAVPFMDIPVDEISLDNLWTLHKSLVPEVSLWKVRAAISGKGSAPRMKLLSRNEKRYELLGINWIYRLMNMR